MARVLSGIQPSGRPHIGNYLGAMKPQIELQAEHECFYFIANYHALTTVKDPVKLKEMTMDVALDYLAIGLDPDKTALFRQSDVPEVTELAWIFDTITHMGLLERAHAWKDAIAKGKKDNSVGLFNYPVLMAADILIYQSNFVPVGQDQKQHIEISRDIAQKFNSTFGETFVIPEPLIKKEVATIIGTDGKHKMSKSYNNTLELFGPEEEFRKKVSSMFTDPEKIKANDPGHPEICNVWKLHHFFSSKDEVDVIAKKCRSGELGCVDDKKHFADNILKHLAPFRDKRKELEGKQDYVEGILQEGARKARITAEKTMLKVREKIGIL